MQILHVSSECYPAAKAGGLGDVAGALPKYLTKAKISSGVVIPQYRTEWINNQSWKTCFKGIINFNNSNIPFTVQELTKSFEFPLYAVDIPGKYDRPGVYLDEKGLGYKDEVERAICFQRAVLQWILSKTLLPKVIHCHDHHTGLLPFMIQYCSEFYKLSKIPTVFTIHNAEYHGTFGWEKVGLLPSFDSKFGGMLDWDQAINPLAAAIKCCWRLTTVSPSYMEELRLHTRGLENLLQNERSKSFGILNGIDAQVWNPSTDAYLAKPLKKSIKRYKSLNKEALEKNFAISSKLPVITFIGRLAGEKGADLLAPTIEHVLNNGVKASFIILGTGEPALHDILSNLQNRYPKFVHIALTYNEELAHQLYAGSDFLWMPSRVEPCGLNQLYAMRYGTLPIVRAVGGLKDTVIDIDAPNGTGIQFNQLTIKDSSEAITRALALYEKRNKFKKIRAAAMQLDFSWEKSASDYIQLYQEIASLD